MTIKQELLEAVNRIGREAGQKILEIYATDFGAEEKSDNSPLTAADMASHEAILAGLEPLLENTPVLSEESGLADYETRKKWSRYWLVDPLDGTKEFIKRNGEFTVNIALIQDHRPVLGVVYVPAKAMGYYAAEGVGAFRFEEGQKPVSIHVRRLAPGQPIIAVASRSHQTPEVAGFLSKLGDHEVTSMGSSLKICLVAEGLADIYPRLGPTCEWDTAAAQAVLEIAGGQLTDTDMAPLRYNTKDSLLNPYFLAFGDAAHNWSDCLPDLPSDAS
ncbi:MAG: 3'(2'),5'-bisphosphate nucleotidase CysQ [Pseudomonadota bacterium]|nr:3'(2'),5'-bisphosphate nucleotidase CysQ [Pseudomonadota bacterium]